MARFVLQACLSTVHHPSHAVHHPSHAVHHAILVMPCTIPVVVVDPTCSSSNSLALTAPVLAHVDKFVADQPLSGASWSVTFTRNVSDLTPAAGGQ